MTIIKKLVKFVTDAKPVRREEELEEGRAAAEGIVRLGEEGGVVSPVNGRPCVAFFYQAFYLAGSQATQFIQRQIKAEQVYSSFILEMEDGKIKAKPKKRNLFSADDHKQLSGTGYNGFHAVEQIVSSGMLVRIWGSIKLGENHKKRNGI